MRKFPLVVFPDEAKAYQGFHALQELHREGTVTIHAAAVVERDENGTLFIKKRSDEVPLGAALGVIIGALQNPLIESARELAPGTFAVIAETAEEWVTHVDARMEAVGGRVVCEWWEGFIVDLLEERTSMQIAPRTTCREKRTRRGRQRS